MFATFRTPHSIGGLLAIVLVGAVCMELATWFWSDSDPCESASSACERPATVPAAEALSVRGASEQRVPNVGALWASVLPGRAEAGDGLALTADAEEPAAAEDPDAEEAAGDQEDAEAEAGEAVDAEEEVEGEGEAEAKAGDAVEASAPSASPAPAVDTATDSGTSNFSNTASLSDVIGVSGLTDVTSRTVVNWRAGETVESWLWPWPGTQNHGVTVPRLSCDAHDAVRISQASQLYLLSDPSYRVFCLAPGDYRELGHLLISGVSGTESAPRVVQLDGDALDTSLGVAESDDDALPTLPATTLVNSNYWQFVGVRWQDAVAAPLTVQGSNGVLFDRVRINLAAEGLSFTGSDNVALQRSLVTGSEWEHSRCLTVDLADGDRFAVTNSEFLGCYQALQIHSSDSGVWGALRVAGNEFHRDSSAGDICDVVGLRVDGGVANGSDTFWIDDNQFSGWTAPAACPLSAGVALSLSDRVDNALLERNVVWGSMAGIAIADGAGDVAVQDSVVVGDGVGHAVRAGSGDGVIALIRNHFVRTDRWLDSQRGALTLSCNAVASSGLPSSPVNNQTLITPTSYFAALPGPVASAGGQDQVETLASHHFGPLCLSTHALSDPSTQCLTDAARNPEFVECGSDYWVAQ